VGVGKCLEGMTRYDPRFWELPVDPGDFDALPAGLLDAPVERDRDPEQERARAEALAGLAEVIKSGLTVKQRRIVELYLYEGRTQQEIADLLGISQQVVSRQLFGVLRNGRRIGGAVARLRRICEEQGWDPSGWV
jgi:DNA-directed RNA polymerase specialized sigma24 family protein